MYKKEPTTEKKHNYTYKLSWREKQQAQNSNNNNNDKKIHFQWTHDKLKWFLNAFSLQ